MKTAQTNPSQNVFSVLLIDDDELVLDAISELLDGEGFQLYTAKSGTEGIAKISNGVRPNIVIVDIRMPIPNGVEIVLNIRRFVGEDVPAIILTDDTSGEEIETINLNKCILIRKPNETGNLAEHVREMAA